MDEALQLERLKNLYGVDFKEEDLVTVYNQYGKPFQMIGSKAEDANVLEGGYIITPDGKFIKVLDRQYHNNVFSLYINNYLGTPNSNKEWESSECSKILNDFGHIVYYGIRVGYLQTLNNPKYVTDNYLRDEKISKISNNLCILSFPKDENITNEQRLCCHQILFSNLKPVGKTYYKKVGISYGNIETGRTYNSDEMDDLLMIDFLQVNPINKDMVNYFSQKFGEMLEIEKLRRNNIKKEYSGFKNHPHQDTMDKLKEAYDKINKSNMTLLEKTKGFQDVFAEARKLNDPIVIKYIMGEHLKLQSSAHKLDLKIHRYDIWKNYLLSLQKVQNKYPKK